MRLAIWLLHAGFDRFDGRPLAGADALATRALPVAEGQPSRRDLFLSLSLGLNSKGDPFEGGGG